MVQTLKGATITVTVRVRRDGAHPVVDVRTDPVMTDAAKQRLAAAIDPRLLIDAPPGNYVFERTMRGGCRIVRAVDMVVAGRMLSDLLLPTHELMHVLIQTLRDIPDREAANKLMGEAYTFVCNHLVDRGEVARIRPGFVEWHFCAAPSKLETVIDLATERQEPNVHLTLRDAKRDLVIVDRAGKIHAYLGVVSDASPFQGLLLEEASTVLRRIAPEAETRSVLRVFRRMSEEAHRLMHASGQIAAAFRFGERPATPVAQSTIRMQGGEPGDA